MKLIKKIMIATDFSVSADDATAMALTVAEVFSSDIYLLHVIPEHEVAAEELHDFKKDALCQLRERAEAAQKGGRRVSKTIVDMGVPFAEIIEQSMRYDVNVVFIGAGERTAGEKYEVGTTANKVIRKSHKPVWLVKRGGPATVKNILCPVDLSEHSHRALKNSIHLARNFSARLHVVHVVRPLSLTYLGIKKKTTDEERDAYNQKHRMEFEHFLKNFDFYNVDWVNELIEGNPSEEIADAARNTNADLIVMGAVGINAHPRLIMGSVAEKVIRELPCSIVTLKYVDPIRLQIESKLEDLAAHCQQGIELLEQGFPEEAMRNFKYCIDKDDMYASAWQGLAEVHKRLGDAEEEDKCREKAARIRQKLEEMRIEAEVRKQHWLWPR